MITTCRCGLNAGADSQISTTSMGSKLDNQNIVITRECSSVGRASGCHPEGREFESLHSLFASVAQLVELLICNQAVVGSNPI